jgi:uncharacterized protein YbaP (TraB family)
MPDRNLPTPPSRKVEKGVRLRDWWLEVGKGVMTWLSVALLITSCGTNQAPTAAAPDQPVAIDSAMPPFYQIDGGPGATLLLMGTIHLGPPEGWKFSPAILEGLDRADRFILEVDLRKATEDAVGTLLANLVIIEPPYSLVDVVSPETAKILDEKDAELARMGMPRNARRRLKPWYITMSLLESATTRSGFSPDASAESVILEALGTRPLIGLETFEEQIKIFDDLSRRNQDLILRDTLLKLDTAVEDIQSLVMAWRRGDEMRLAELARDGIDELPELDAFFDIIGSGRNRRWVPKLRSFLDNPEYASETLFVGVGALHLVGDDGLVDLLRAEGYAVEKVDHSGIQRAEQP